MLLGVDGYPMLCADKNLFFLDSHLKSTRAEINSAYGIVPD